jgi:cobalt-zinc-cadmium efflux system membrane fusion protein
LFVRGEIEVNRIDAPVTVKRSAVQTFRDWQVVFRNRESLYEIAIVELGLVDGEFVQVLSGLSPGESYVSENSFVVKADIGKAGASHDH